LAEKGRPSKMTKEKTDLAIELAKEGRTIAAICKLLKIDKGTYYNWAKNYPELKVIIDEEKRQAELKEIEAVRLSLVKRAKGYKTKEIKEHFDESGNLLSYDVTTKEIPADVKAQQFYLINKDPNEWKLQPTGDGNGDETDNVLNITIED